MTANTKIEWADHTFNPWEGCQKVGPGCDHCYAENRNARFGGGTAPNWGAGAPRRRTSVANWRKPITWNNWAPEFFAQYDRRQRVFCASLADVFDNEVDPAWRADLFELIAATPQLDWLLLTKRVGNAHLMIEAAVDRLDEKQARGATEVVRSPWPWKNVWLGATVVNQEEADRDIPKLLATPAAVRFLSIEPMLGPIDLTQIEARAGFSGIDVFSALEYDGDPDDDVEFGTATLDWVIAGGESGSGARPTDPDWPRSLRDQCAAAGVPFLWKQWGEWLPGSQARDVGNQIALVGACERGYKWDNGTHSWRIGKAAAGRLLDGIEHNGFPTP